jgi:hypothetical protein
MIKRTCFRALALACAVAALTGCQQKGETERAAGTTIGMAPANPTLTNVAATVPEGDPSLPSASVVFAKAENTQSGQDSTHSALTPEERNRAMPLEGQPNSYSSDASAKRGNETIPREGNSTTDDKSQAPAAGGSGDAKAGGAGAGADSTGANASPGANAGTDANASAGASTDSGSADTAKSPAGSPGTGSSSTGSSSTESSATMAPATGASSSESGSGDSSNSALTPAERSSAMPMEGQPNSYSSDAAAKRGNESMPRTDGMPAESKGEPASASDASTSSTSPDSGVNSGASADTNAPKEAQ